MWWNEDSIIQKDGIKEGDSRPTPTKPPFTRKRNIKVKNVIKTAERTGIKVNKSKTKYSESLGELAFT